MAQQKRQKIALVGNPNSGKSSLFNYLTGLNQKVGNFPGVTVDKRSGLCKLPVNHETDFVDLPGISNGGDEVEIVDLPGIYSVYPRSLDESIVTEVLLNKTANEFPDKVIVIADVTNLKRSLLLATQIIDLGLPVVLALNMMDLAAKAGISYDFNGLSKTLGVPVVPINARQGIGLNELKKAIAHNTPAPANSIFKIWPEAKEAITDIRKSFDVCSDYAAYLFLEQPATLHFLSREDQQKVTDLRSRHNFFPGKFQGAETIQRYTFIQDLLNEVTLKTADYNWKKNTRKLDQILTHKVWGYAIFLAILFFIFQSIFAWAQVPMDFIDWLFAKASESLGHLLPEGPLSNLITEGLVPGIGGIMIFIPQIAILFAFISILEETGYMARVVFLMDKIMRKFGLNGKSVVPLISGVACAIPAIMATRTIDNWKERTITIFVTPLMSCSARLPVFAILIGLIVPDQKVFWFFNLQGLALMGLYLLGFFTAIGSAWIMSMIIKIKERSYLIMELPTYRWPKWSNVGLTIVEKTKSFVFEAGKVIMAISIILWVLASYGPGDNIANARENVLKESANLRLTEEGLETRIASYKLEHSYAGIIGKSIEPAIKPLGYDWKIGIALITSFAAREVFVGTMATIYSIGQVDESDEQGQATIKSRMRQEINPETGGPRFTPAAGFSLLLFYTFAMQCMSTMAVVYRETKGWKWPAIQFIYMTSLAYLSSLIAYQLLS